SPPDRPAAPRGPGGQRQARPPADGGTGYPGRAACPAEAHDGQQPRLPTLPQPGREPGGGAAPPGVGGRHHLHPPAGGLRRPGRPHGRLYAVDRGWHLARSLERELTLAALDKALWGRSPEVHHSDQGLQYAATEYVRRLEGCGAAISMAAIGEPRENGY